ncbi:hypothetical protein BUALT_Bualt08G0029700 [Buddleja alternifolia]|uniref:Uncharacterized protein n=1 Tax=Buddleja alternifolia TaxID=168488 RepID=A0AAV6X3L9_9LAMI|nr:hypothetical protein BUALT_Bualt08G0029700 [Buddleja alternifolia]
MVRAVIGDETQFKLAEDRLTRSSLPSQVGLVIGKLSSTLDRGFMYDLLPTPPNDAGEPPCAIIDGVGENNRNKKKNSSKAKSQPDSSALFIDNDWVSEHARQVSRMLLGGMGVVGIYIWVNESLFKNSAITLCQVLSPSCLSLAFLTVKGVVEAASLMMTDWNEGLLIHLSYSPLRWTCRSCSLAANVTSSSLRPCDFKMGKVLGSLQTFRCTYNFDVRLPVAHEDGLDVKGFADVLRGEITILNKELTGAHALINGKLVIEDELCILEDFNDVEFLLPLLQDKYVEACSQKEVLGVVSISGSVCSLTYLNSKEPTSQALMDIKGDIIRSLQSRLEIISDDADRELEPVADGGQETNSKTLSDKPVSRFDRQAQRKQCNLSFPRRVFIPWLEGTYICDYIQSSETMEMVVSNGVAVGAATEGMVKLLAGSCVLDAVGVSANGDVGGAAGFNVNAQRLKAIFQRLSPVRHIPVDQTRPPELLHDPAHPQTGFRGSKPCLALVPLKALLCRNSIPLDLKLRGLFTAWKGLIRQRQVGIKRREGIYGKDPNPYPRVEVVKDHCVELMSIEVPSDASEILEPETEAHNVIASTTKSFWDTATGISSNNSVRGSTNEKPTKATDFNPTIPILVLVLSVIVGLVCYILKI